jgi:hypothetical protein
MRTHAELVDLARRWLDGARRCCLVATDLVTACGETPDAIGWCYGGSRCLLVECKASRADFRRDKDKACRRRTSLARYPGLGHQRYFLAEPGVIPEAEVPENWGLLEVQANGRIFLVREAPSCESDRDAEVTFLLSVIRRMGPNTLPGVGVKFYTLDGPLRGTVGLEPLLTITVTSTKEGRKP